MIHTTYYNSPLGPLYLAGEGEALVGAWFEGQKYFARTLPAQREERETPALEQTREWLDRYFAGERPPVAELPLAPKGSPFRQVIWQLLTEIPYGQVTTYGQLAQGGGQTPGQGDHVRPGGGGGRGPQPHQRHHPLPPGGGQRRQPDGLRRGAGH